MNQAALVSGFLTARRREQNVKTFSEFPNPCPNGFPLMVNKVQPQTCNGLATSSSCPSGHWCHVGASLNTTVCCPGASDPCKLAVDSGVGDATLSRWYFEPESKKCLAFTYSGMKGNQNNFVSQDACHVICRGKKLNQFVAILLTELTR